MSNKDNPTTPDTNSPPPTQSPSPPNTTEAALPDPALLQLTPERLAGAIDNAIGAVVNKAASNDIYNAFRTFREELRKAIGV